MASNLGTGDAGGFNISNMKPSSGDQIDALWGQNIADNTAHAIWGQEKRIAEVYSNHFFIGANAEAVKHAWFRKVPSQDTITGTYAMAGFPLAFAEGTLSFFVDGTVVENNKVLTGLSGSSFSYDCSHLTDGVLYDMEVHHSYSIGSFSELSFSAWVGTLITT